MPKFNQLFTEVLEVLSDGKDWGRVPLREAVIQKLDLTQAELGEKLPGGGVRINSRVHWAAQYLAVVRATERPSRGIMRITERGRALLANNPGGVTLEDLKVFPEFKDWDERSKSKRKEGQSSAVDLSTSDTVPMEQIEGAVGVLRSTVRDDLLARLRSEDPEFLERAVLKVLHAMGYGSSSDDLEHLGGPGDGGVDGLIRQDKLGLDLIYVQAKRHKEENKVGRPTIQQFVGALSGKSATRGVFITTSEFSDDARKFVTALPGQKVILLDGEEFADLMIEHEVGVSVSHLIKTYEVDENFFDED
jgi:restriction system protein